MKLKYLVMVGIVLAMLVLSGCPKPQAAPASAAPAEPADAGSVDAGDSGVAETGAEEAGEPSAALPPKAEAPEGSEDVEIVKERAGREYQLISTEDLPSSGIEDIIQNVQCHFDTLTMSFNIANIDAREKYLGRVLTFGDAAEAFKVSINGNRIRDLAAACGAETIKSGEALSCVKKFTRTEFVDDYALRGAGTTYSGYTGIENFNRINGRMQFNGVSSSDEDFFRCVNAGENPADAVFLTREDALASRYTQESGLAPKI